jgi:hypothetical protein
MVDQRKNDKHPTRLGLTFEHQEFSSQSQHDALEGQREVEDPTDESFADFDGDFTDDTDQHAASLRVIVENAPRDAHDFEPQPASAFSPSSSEGDNEDDDNDSGEQDRYDNDSRTIEEQHDVGIRYTPPPAFRGSTGKDDIYDIYRVNPFTSELYPMYPSTGRSAHRVKRKKEQYSNRPSKKRTVLTSPPVSPNNNTGLPTQVGVLPEPSPEAEAEGNGHVLSTVEPYERPRSALGQHASDVNRVWSEEDEDDTSWVSDAIAEVTGSLTGSAESSHDAGDEDHPEPSDDADRPLSPVSPLDKAGALDALRADSDPNVEDHTATWSEMPDRHLESFQDGAAPPMEVAPVPVKMPAHLRDPTSPDPDGPETLTGLTPLEGIETWWEWRDRKTSFNDKRNPYNQDKTGDLKAIFDSDDKDEAADVLSKQRFILNQKVSRGVTVVSDAMREVELSQEYVKLSMLKYRHQRNHFREDAVKFRLDAKLFKERVGRRDQTIEEQDDALLEHEQAIEKLKIDKDRASTQFYNALAAVKETVAQNEKLAAIFERYKRDTQQTIDDARRELGIRNRPLQMASIMTVISEEPVAAADHDAGEKERLHNENRELSERLSKSTAVAQDIQSNIPDLGLQLAGSCEDRLQLQARVDDLTKELSESQATRATLDNSCTELHDRVAQLEQELEDLDMTRRANAGSTATLSERVEAAEALARDQQATIERLEAENVTCQQYADESAAAIRVERNAAREEANALEGALLEHGWSSYAPSRKHTLVSVNDQGTQTDKRASSARPKILVKERIPAPVRAVKKQQLHTEASRNPSGWAARKQAIMQQQAVAVELESRRAAREKRQAVELERLDQIRQRMGAMLNVDGRSYVPLEARMVAVAV